MEEDIKNCSPTVMFGGNPLYFLLPVCNIALQPKVVYTLSNRFPKQSFLIIKKATFFYGSMTNKKLLKYKGDYLSGVQFQEFVFQECVFQEFIIQVCHGANNVITYLNPFFFPETSLVLCFIILGIFNADRTAGILKTTHFKLPKHFSQK